MFKLYVQFLSDAGLLGKTTIGIDGSKFKAVNSKKNNYNQKKIDKYQQFIKDKAEKYLQELDELDKQESVCGSEDLQIKKEKITQGLAKLKERTIKYDNLQENALIKAIYRQNEKACFLKRHSMLFLKAV